MGQMKTRHSICYYKNAAEQPAFSAAFHSKPWSGDSSFGKFNDNNDRREQGITTPGRAGPIKLM